MTKIAAMTIYGKNPRNLLLQNHWASCLETCFVIIRNSVLQSLYKDDLGLTLNSVYGKVKFTPSGSCMGKAEKVHIFMCSCDL